MELLARAETVPACSVYLCWIMTATALPHRCSASFVKIFIGVIVNENLSLSIFNGAVTLLNLARDAHPRFNR